MKKTLKSVDVSLLGKTGLSIVVLIMGILIMIFKTFGLTDLNLYVSLLFFTYAFFCIIAYFVKRNEGDYELLLLALINIIAASFIYFFKSDDVPMILGGGMCIYTVLLVMNRSFKVVLLNKRNSFMWIVKFIVTFLIGFLGVLTAFNLFNNITVQTMLFGYYFINLGFLLTLENLIEIFITEESFRKILYKILKEENKLENIEEEKPKKVKRKVSKK